MRPQTLLALGFALAIAATANAAISSSGSVSFSQQGSIGPFAAGQFDTTGIVIDNADILLNVTSRVGLDPQPSDIQIGVAGTNNTSMTIRSSSALDFTLRFTGDVFAPPAAQGPVRFATYFWNIDAQERTVDITMETIVEGVSRTEVNVVRGGFFNNSVSGQSSAQSFSIAGNTVSLETIIRIQVSAGPGQTVIGLSNTGVRTPWLIPSPSALALAGVGALVATRRRR